MKSGMVGYNVQAAVDAQHHLIVAHEVTNKPHDRGFLAPMTSKAKAAMGAEETVVLATVVILMARRSRYDEPTSLLRISAKI